MHHACRCPCSPRNASIITEWLAVFGACPHVQHQSQLLLPALLSTSCTSCTFQPTSLFAGDNFYPSGLTSANDPQFASSFKNVYSAPALKVSICRKEAHCTALHQRRKLRPSPAQPACAACHAFSSANPCALQNIQWELVLGNHDNCDGAVGCPNCKNSPSFQVSAAPQRRCMLTAVCCFPDCCCCNQPQKCVPLASQRRRPLAVSLCHCIIFELLAPCFTSLLPSFFVCS